MSVTTLEGPNPAWVIDAVEDAFENHGSLKHIIKDQVKTEGFSESLTSWNIKHRFGAVGQHGSIAVTERVIKTLKYEWLKRVPIIKGFKHLGSLCDEFSYWYNEWRPHMGIEGRRPDDVYLESEFEPVSRSAKIVPLNIEKRRFRETRITAYRLKNAA